MKLSTPINTETLPAGDEFDPIPIGRYRAMITKAEIKETNARTGEYINLQLAIDGPTHEGYKVFAILNIRNPSEMAEKIGRGQLGQLTRAIGLVTDDLDTDDLEGKMVEIKVGIRKSEEYGDKNDVKAFYAIDGSAAPAPKGKKKIGSAPAGKKTASKGKTPPWQAKPNGEPEDSENTEPTE